MKKLDLPREEITNLYANEGISSKKLAERYGCANRTVLLRLREWDVPLRLPGTARVVIDKAELEKLYLKDGLSTWKIPKILGYDRGTIHRKLKEFGIPVRNLSKSHIKYRRKPFSGDSLEKAYLIGFGVGDLRARKVGKNSETIHVDCGSTKTEQIRLFKRLFKKYGRVWVGKPHNGKRQMEAFLNMSFSFLLSPKREVPQIFKNFNIFLSFLGGFIDAEGSFFITQRKSRFFIGNYNNQLLSKISRKLKERGIKTRLYVDKNRYVSKEGYVRQHDYCMLTIHKQDDVLRFINMIQPYLQHKDRIDCLLKAKNNIISAENKQSEKNG
ncbi:MAG: hypothetical protein KGI04_03905 [Candidatus Micrarchaeota archaeon]|nr:hypothetical protein [Candidatus Micrarchaeota archaeon]